MTLYGHKHKCPWRHGTQCLEEWKCGSGIVWVRKWEESELNLKCTRDRERENLESGDNGGNNMADKVRHKWTQILKDGCLCEFQQNAFRQIKNWRRFLLIMLYTCTIKNSAPISVPLHQVESFYCKCTTTAYQNKKDSVVQIQYL